MKTTSLITALGICAGVLAAPAMAAGTLLKFDKGIGVHPVAGLSGTPNAAGAFPDVLRNDVQGVPPGGRPWVIEKLKVTVKDDGSISARGEGLLLAGGNGIGTVGPVTSVAASLFCGTQRFDSDAAPLSTGGNFVIGGLLNTSPPNPCTGAVLLIRNASSTGGVVTLGSWFAAGIRGDED